LQYLLTAGLVLGAAAVVMAGATLDRSDIVSERYDRENLEPLNQGVGDYIQAVR
jgi:hypothetical protein